MRCTADLDRAFLLLVCFVKVGNQIPFKESHLDQGFQQ